MKKFFLLAFVAVAFVACNNEEETEVTTDTTTVVTPAPVTDTFPTVADTTVMDTSVAQ